MKKYNTKKRYQKKTRKLYKSIRKTKRRINHKKYYGGTLIDEATQIKYRDSFRTMFIEKLDNLKTAIETHNPEKIEQAFNKFKNGFTSQKMGINLRILATTDTFQTIDKKQTYNKDSSDIALFPCLVIIYENILDTKIRKKLTEAFVKNGGNINLKSTKGNLTALADAIKLRDKSLIQLLRNKDIAASDETLTEEQKVEMESILTEPVIAPVIEEPPSIESSPEIIEEEEIPTTKLIIPTQLPPESGYPIDIEPEFWLPLFGVNNMIILRDKLRSMMESDRGIPMDETDRTKISDIWSVCKILQRLIPTYFVPTKIEVKQKYGTTIYENPTDFYQNNILLCAALLVFGIISYKMKFQDYELIFKGGKAIQLVLSSILGIDKYKSEDIDVLLMTKKDIEYNEINIKNLSGHIAYLIKWFLTTTSPNISILPPNPANPRANPFIFKVSYLRTDRQFSPISDIDFRDIPQNIKSYFERPIDFQFTISELQERVLFKCPDIGSLLDEKLYYYSKYSIFKDLLTKGQPITEPGYETVTISLCDYLLTKFKRAIITLNNGLQIRRNSEILASQLDSENLNPIQIKNIVNRLKRLNITDPNIQNLIIKGLQEGVTTR